MTTHSRDTSTCPVFSQPRLPGCLHAVRMSSPCQLIKSIVLY